MALADGDNEILDEQTSAAILVWMETSLLPDGLTLEVWERWIEGGCRGGLEAEGRQLTPEQLGRWARSCGAPR